jgi:aspartate racemase
MTAHAFHGELQDAIGLPIINGAELVAQYLKTAGIQRVGVLATDGALAAGVFQKELQKLDIEYVLPDQEHQSRLMDLIYAELKAGYMPDYDEFEGIIAKLRQEEKVQALVLGCTELSLIKKCYEDKFTIQAVDALEILAECSLQSCGKKIRKDG